MKEFLGGSPAMGATGARGISSLLLPLLIALGMALGSAAVQHGGILHYEVEKRLPYYLSNAPLLNKIYDSDYLDDGMYQARELSYVFDYVDCKFIALCVRFAHPHFLSLIQYVFLIVISLALWRFGREDLKLDRWLVLCVLQLFWTSPAVFLGGNFFRTAKIGVTLVVVMLYGIIFRCLRAARENPSFAPSMRLRLTCFGWAWAATLFDRQGVFFIGVIIVFLGFWYFGFREDSVVKLVSPFVAAFALCFLYNYIIAPLLTLLINDYWPDFKYQHLPWSDLAQRPWHYMAGGLLIYLDAVRFSFGDLPVWGAAVLIAGLIGLGFGTAARRGKMSAVLGFVLSQTVLIWVMIVLMYLRHEAMIWPEIRRGGYLLPAIAMLTMTLLLALARIQARWTVPKWGLPVLLGAVLVGNISALPSHRALVTAGAFKVDHGSTPAVLDALRHLRDPNYHVPPEVADNRVYRFFHDGFFSRYPGMYHREKASKT